MYTTAVCEGYVWHLKYWGFDSMVSTSGNDMAEFKLRARIW
jgi:hypothetical protein